MKKLFHSDITETKGFGKALFFWLIGGFFGLPLVYTTERAHFLVWFWALSIITFGIAPLVTVFFLRSLVETANEVYVEKYSL